MSSQDETECFHGRTAGTNCVFCPGGAAISKADARAKNGRVAKVSAPAVKKTRTNAPTAEKMAADFGAAFEMGGQTAREAERQHAGQAAKIEPAAAGGALVDGYRLAAAVVAEAGKRGLKPVSPAESARLRDEQEAPEVPTVEEVKANLAAARANTDEKLAEIRGTDLSGMIDAYQEGPTKVYKEVERDEYERLIALDNPLRVTLGPKLAEHLAALVPDELYGDSLQAVAQNLLWRWLEAAGKLPTF